jgi:hypothetical protein
MRLVRSVLTPTRNVVAHRPVPLEPEVEDLVRRACFAAAAPALIEFGVRPDEIVDHLTSAGLSVANRPDRVLANLDGVAHAVACVRGDARAWSDLANRHGWCLERAAMDRHGAEGGLASRRFWLELRSGTLCGPSDRLRQDGWPLPRLQWYAGLRPLRHWLADRLFGGIEAGQESLQRRLDTPHAPHSLPDPAIQIATAT